MDHGTKNHAHVIGYGTYILVWLGLLSFTGITVAVAGMDLQFYNIAIALIIATVKAIMVMTIFMHLKFEDRVFRIFATVAILTLLIFLVLTFFDYSFAR
ncbi:MAG: cytochrome-c oxidase [Ignavibacteria bacterium]|nr:cytochrome-c oxidase [Ignavibacteria bacterium]